MQYGTKELVLSLIYPSNTAFVLLTLLLMFVDKNYTATYFSHTVSFNYICLLLASKFLVDVYSMLTIRCGYNDYKTSIEFFFVSPVLYVKSLLSGVLKNTYSRPLFTNKKTPKADTLNFDKHTVDATITNGKKDLPCKLEITKTDEYSQVVFIFNNKRLSSSKQPRINYATEEIINNSGAMDLP